MTLDEAIKHCEDVAEHNDNLIRWGCISESVIHNCRECAADHKQLSEWLRELKERRAAVKRGRWIAIKNGAMLNWKQKCSVCGDYHRGKTNYCGNCGADMKEGE